MNIFYRDKYYVQYRRARNRGIEFNLTFDEWLGWWKSTGKLEQRGRNWGQYVMARYNDSGAYELGNIKCITHVENSREGHLGKIHTLEARRKISLAFTGGKASDETKRKMSQAQKGKNNPMYGKIHSDEAKYKMSKAHMGVKNSMYGKTHSEETKRKISETKKRKRLNSHSKKLKENEL